MRLVALRIEAHNRALRFRRIEATTRTRTFEYLWNNSTGKAADEVIDLIESGNEYGLRQWILHHPKIDLGDWPLNRLKSLGQSLGITNYSRLPKLKLVKAIEEARIPHDVEENSSKQS